MTTVICIPGSPLDLCSVKFLNLATMKTKIFGYVLITLIYIFPFRYAVLEPTPSNTVNLLCMVATVFGTLIFMGLTMSESESHAGSASAGQAGAAENMNEKAAA